MRKGEKSSAATKLSPLYFVIHKASDAERKEWCDDIVSCYAPHIKMHTKYLLNFLRNPDTPEMVKRIENATRSVTRYTVEVYNKEKKDDKGEKDDDSSASSDSSNTKPFDDVISPDYQLTKYKKFCASLGKCIPLRNGFYQLQRDFPVCFCPCSKHMEGWMEKCKWYEIPVCGAGPSKPHAILDHLKILVKIVSIITQRSNSFHSFFVKETNFVQ